MAGENRVVTNRLAEATSPYLQQHADNPVDWWPWCDEAFTEAKRRDVPIFLSIGYAACHWCHVMAHESFEDESTAAQLNADFVSIKVDREERPDVDAVYMAAVQGLTGHGGWPMTVFLNSERKPFHAGTYFPLESRGGMPSFRQVLTAVTDAWVERRGEIDQGAAQIVNALEARQGIDSQDNAMSIDPTKLSDALTIALQRLAHDFDPVNAGFGTSPKFPPSTALEFLLRHANRTGATEALSLAEATCEAMARGGIYDQLAGGFARYSVDAQWVVPHFEKMLYDNAQLLRVYAHLYATTGSALAGRIATETAEFLLRDLRTAEGGFASALDADAPAEPGGVAHEGISYVWTPEQLVDVLGAERGENAARMFGVTSAGTFEAGASVLQFSATGEALASATVGADFEEWLEQVRADLLAARNLRPQPVRDDKVVAAWNGLAIAALADAGAAFDRPDWIDAAVSCGELILDVHVTKGSGSQLRLTRTSRDGAAATNASGVLEDYGDVAEGLLALYQATADPRWINATSGLLETVLVEFVRPQGGFFDTAADGEALIVRPCDPTDQASASGWAAATNALLSYGTIMGSERHLRAAESGLRIADQLARKAPRFAGWLLAAAEAWLDGPFEVVIVGERRADVDALVAATKAANRPGLIVVSGLPQPDEKSGPFADRPEVDGKAAAYVCRGSYCHAPVTTAAEVARLLA